MKVTAQVQKQVIKVLEAGVAKINKHYNRTDMRMPRVLFNKRGTTAGVANHRDWTVNFNAVLLMENTEEFLSRTVPHELAHLGTYLVYPDSMTGGITFDRFGRPRREKRDIHGYYWQEVMRVLGVKDISRCHSYDVSNARVKKKARHIYVCTAPGCGIDVSVGPKVHAHLQRDPSSRWHRGHRGWELKLKGEVASTPQPRKVLPYVPPIKRKVRPIQPRYTTSKKDRAEALYRANKDKLFRQDMIDLFMKQLDMTRPGATTYFYTCQKTIG